MPDLKSESGSAAPGDGQTRARSNGQGTSPESPDPLANLYRMSTTAGVGSQEYVAINSTAIAALILGLGSVLVIVHPMLLVVPVAGVICAVLAFVQIRNSNGTQTGRGLAAIGLLLALGFGAAKAGIEIFDTLRTRKDEQQILQLIQTLAQDLSKDQYDQAYALFNDRFHSRVDQITFEAAFKRIEQSPEAGPLASIQWNKEPMYFESGDEGREVASAMTFFRWQQAPEPGSRLLLNFVKEGGRWELNDMPSLFPPAKKGKKNPAVEGP